eukprot:CAMPEP_0175857454 /NCGR_PEP_ID=MMETSP0107_2-20121207/29104_1 /TAXON_ID=195067 ORGANISM="Goniomonas pacifica, Strain CCMP1869" /NCGR_SAMPLE_ID=MMETSP0107_2 /ASSEMBLY_ACC=CAM_ASM_000203 /LENGTH=80 /DNA_ID=CAMNT_0017173755 /DNA_START=99 /DNA_END=341 /DNA_ORIENTATION=+
MAVTCCNASALRWSAASPTTSIAWATGSAGPVPPRAAPWLSPVTVSSPSATGVAPSATPPAAAATLDVASFASSCRAMSV